MTEPSLKSQMTHLSLIASGEDLTSWKWQPSPVLLPGKSHGQRSLAGYGPWGRRESDTTEATKQQQVGDPSPASLGPTPSHTEQL